MRFAAAENSAASTPLMCPTPCQSTLMSLANRWCPKARGKSRRQVWKMTV